MAWRIVRQPNGFLARFSDVVDDFTHMNMTVEEAIVVCCEHGATKAKVLYGLRDLDETGKPGKGLGRWKACLSQIQFHHGPGQAQRTRREGMV